jgi:hypothetical protein
MNVSSRLIMMRILYCCPTHYEDARMIEMHPLIMIGHLLVGRLFIERHK